MMSRLSLLRGILSRAFKAAVGLFVKVRAEHARESEPAMIGTPPSLRQAREIPTDPGDHAADFAARYSEPLDYLVSQRMLDLGIPDDQIGAGGLGIPHAAFWAHERTGGGNVPGPRFTVDSGVFNPELMARRPTAGSLWAKSRLRDRIDAIIAHEVAESQTGDHNAAEAMAPDVDLPISEPARRLLRVIRGEGAG